MLMIEYHDGLRPRRVPADRVLIYDGHGNPIAAAVALSDDFCMVESQNNPEEFASMLRELGLHHTVVVSTLSPANAPQR